MVSVCPNHVKNALDLLDVPHVYQLNSNDVLANGCKCQFCHTNAHYKMDYLSPCINKEIEQKNSQVNK